MKNSSEYELNISEKQIKKYISNHDSFLHDIQFQRVAILKDIRNQYEYRSSLILRSHKYDEIAISHSNIVSDSVYDTFIRLQEDYSRNTIISLQSQLIMLNKQECTLNRVCTSFHRIMTVCPVGYNILYELCYKKDKTQTWESKAQELGKSRTYLSNAIKTTLKVIKCLYDTSYTTEEIAKLSESKLVKLIESSGLVEIDKY